MIPFASGAASVSKPLEAPESGVEPIAKTKNPSMSGLIAAAK